MVEVRALTSSDHASWSRLWDGYLEFYHVDLDNEVWDAAWQRLTDPTSGIDGAMSHIDGEAVGLVHWFAHPSLWRVEPIVYLQDLFIAKSERGQGHGRALIEHVYRTADAGGAADVYWHTHESNADAMMLYDRIASRTGFLHYRHILAAPFVQRAPTEDTE